MNVDVAILGGGLAGLCLAIQLKEARPATTIVVLERAPHPAPEAAHKVGESSVEIGARYFARIVGMREHIIRDQLPKFGLRFFFGGGGKPLEQRAEHGAVDWAYYSDDPYTYQLDRGRFENALREKAVALGVSFVDRCSVQDIGLGEPHTVRARVGNDELVVTARWVVDAAGRRNLLKRPLGLRREVTHAANAVWFRIARELDVEALTEDVAWRARVPEGKRRFSTNHFLGHGYWVWFIPLASGSTSVGIVAEEASHPLTEMRTFDRAVDWLRRHEPQCAALVEQHREHLQDFIALRQFSHGCSQVYSADRWCITGEAGAFLDPFYSPGSDFIAISNGFVTRLVCTELDGGDIRATAALYDALYLQIFEHSLLIYDGQYPVMGGQESMLAKLVWDAAVYVAFLMTLYFSQRICDPEVLAGARAPLDRLSRLETHVQALFRQWAARERATGADTLGGGFYTVEASVVADGMFDRLGQSPDARRSSPTSRRTSTRSSASRSGCSTAPSPRLTPGRSPAG